MQTSSTEFVLQLDIHRYPDLSLVVVAVGPRGEVARQYIPVSLNHRVTSRPVTATSIPSDMGVTTLSADIAVVQDVNSDRAPNTANNAAGAQIFVTPMPPSSPATPFPSRPASESVAQHRDLVRYLQTVQSPAGDLQQEDQEEHLQQDQHNKHSKC